LRNACNRGDSRPFRHEKPEDQGELANQNIKDRYYGVNDPVAKKLLKRVEDRKPDGPFDKDVKTLFVGNVDKRIQESDLKDHFYCYGEIQSIKLVPAQHCAFVEFTTPTAAQAAMGKLQGSLIISGVYLKVAWAKSHQLLQTRSEAQTSRPESYTDSAFYPSMDPERLGAIPDEDRANKAKSQQPATGPTPVQPPPINWAPPAPASSSL